MAVRETFVLCIIHTRCQLYSSCSCIQCICTHISVHSMLLETNCLERARSFPRTNLLSILDRHYCIRECGTCSLSRFSPCNPLTLYLILGLTQISYRSHSHSTSLKRLHPSPDSLQYHHCEATFSAIQPLVILFQDTIHYTP